MHRIVCASVGLLLAGLAPLASVGAPLTTNVPPKIGSPVTLVQDRDQPGHGWWEREDRGDDARQRYWQLRRNNLTRYNQLQAEIYQLQQQRAQIDARINADIAEQHRMLGY